MCSSKNKKNKSEIAAYYGVDNKTLNKWIKYFAAKIFPDYDIYLKRRKLSYLEYRRLIEILGDPVSNPVLSKREIITQAEGSYRSLRESVQKFPSHFGLSIEAFSSLRKFPPNLGKQILEQYK